MALECRPCPCTPSRLTPSLSGNQTYILNRLDNGLISATTRPAGNMSSASRSMPVTGERRSDCAPSSSYIRRSRMSRQPKIRCRVARPSKPSTGRNPSLIRRSPPARSRCWRSSSATASWLTMEPFSTPGQDKCALCRSIRRCGGRRESAEEAHVSSEWECGAMNVTKM